MMLQDAFNEFVESLLNRPENLPNQEMLQSAFNSLVPQRTKIPANRQDSKKFRNDFERFVMAVQGSLVVE